MKVNEKFYLGIYLYLFERGGEGEKEEGREKRRKRGRDRASERARER